MRAGHTEAGCDLARMAGLTPASVICEIMNEDGTMARLPQLEVFAQQHGLKIGTIADLITYRSRNETLIESLGQRRIESAQGAFDAHVFRDATGQVHLALTTGRWGPDDEVLVRVHEPVSPLDLLDASAHHHSWPLPQALRALSEAGRGVAVLLNCSRESDALLRDLLPPTDAQPPALDLRTYGVGVQILRALGVRRMSLLSNRRRMPSMAGFGLELVGFKPYAP
jgi:3,4-dihydroxy 2-butanone 4-phosphate synthase/GTP cyclohydrolase II